MRKLLLVFIGLPITLAAQISLSSTSLTFSTRQYLTPYLQRVAVNGTGNIKLGAITSPQGFPMTGYVGTHLASAAAPTTLYVWIIGYAMSNMSAIGTAYASIPVSGSAGCAGACTINLTLRINAPSALTTVQPYRGSAGNCKNSSGLYLDADVCTIPNARPGGNFTPPGLGGSYIDPNFNGPVTQITQQGVNASGRVVAGDATTSNVNAGGTLVLTQALGGHYFIASTAGSGDVWKEPPIGNSAVWDAGNPLAMYSISGLTVRKTVFKKPPSGYKNTTVYTYAPPGGVTPAMLDNGGDGDVSQDNWWCLTTHTGGDTAVVLIDLHNGKGYVGNWGSVNYSGYYPRSAYITNIDRGTHKRYCVLSMVTNGGRGSYDQLWSLSPGSETPAYEGNLPQIPDAAESGEYDYPTCTNAAANATNCIGYSHNSVVEIAGSEYLAYAYQGRDPYIQWTAWFRLSDGATMMIPVEAGGHAIYFPVTRSANGDTHTGCAKAAAVCVISTDSDPPIPGYRITGASGKGASPIQVISGAGAHYPGANGDVLLIAGVSGNTALNGLCKVSSFTAGPPVSFSCAGMTGNGSYAPNSGSFLVNTTPAKSSHQAEIMVFDFTSNKFKMIRVAKSRSWETGAYYTPYYGQSHASISPDGKEVAWESNFGYVDQFAVVVAPTGANPAVPVASTVVPERR